jgi:hypothetical protein
VTITHQATYEPQHYQLSARDNTGQLLGKSTTQLAVLGLAVVLGALSATIRGPLLIGLPVAVTLGLVGVAPWKHQRPLVEQLGALAAYALTPKVWSARFDLLTSAAKRPQLPPQMAGLLLHEMTDPKGRDVCLIEDQKVGRLSVAVRVVGRRFALASTEEQDAMLGEWAAALTPFGRRGGPVVGLAWTSWASPTRIEAHRAWMAAVTDPLAPPEARQSYEEVLAATGAHASSHDVVVTLTVDVARAARGPGQRRGPRQAPARRAVAGATLLRELALFTKRLAGSGLDASAPLSGPELARVLRERLDPGCVGRLDELGRSLGDIAGLVGSANAGPLHCEQRRTAWRTDATMHRALVVSEWPRTPVGADWMGTFLLDVDCVRLVSVIFEPLDPLSSTRQVEFAMANHEGDLSHRDEKRRVVTGQARRRGQNIARREEQLLDGHIEFRYLGLVVVSAPDDEALDRASEAVTEAGARCRMELRPVDGQHAAAVVAALPLGRLPRRASA